MIVMLAAIVYVLPKPPKSSPKVLLDNFCVRIIQSIGIVAGIVAGIAAGHVAGDKRTTAYLEFTKEYQYGCIRY